MEDSILVTIKKILGLSEEYTAFDLDILTHINAAFSVLDQLGVGPEGGHFIVDDLGLWADIGLPPNQLNLVKTYIGLKVRMLFDPPSSGFVLTSMEKQIAEFESRLNMFREVELDESVDS